jgi:hypothetical protein
MFCVAGAALLHQFEDAAERRAKARDEVLQAHEECDLCEESLYLAKQRYGEAFVAWVNHRSCCVSCRAASVPHDVAQFASL